MQTQHLDFLSTGKFSSIFLDYLSQNENLQSFSGLFPSPENFAKQIHQKRNSYPSKNRKVLKNALQNQYQNSDLTPPSALELLTQENVFTLTTGHQLNIFTGPLYFHYKIITVINACQELNKKYPDFKFLPVYWMASEDHDFEEISYFRLFGKKYQWQSEQKGAVGRFQSKELATLLEQLPENHPLFEAYLNSETLAEATRKIVHELYAHQNLLIVDGDDTELKKLFRPILEQEIFEMPSYSRIRENSAQLEAKNYKAQVYPREINLFYLGENFRERIVKKEENFEILNTEIQFSAQEIRQEIEKSPEKFSPNVALRPVYQEVILPNLSYTGGPGELAYWLQLKGVFEYFEIPYPILLPRNFALILASADQKKMEKLGLSATELFIDFDTLRKKFVAENTENSISLSSEIEALEETLNQVKSKGMAVGLPEKMFEAEKQRLRKSLEKVEKKIAKTEEQKFEQSLNQLAKLHEKIFPNGSLQERTENFQTFWLNHPNFLTEIQEVLKPFDFQFYILKMD